jgi:ubiquinone/menaquinone biosynthesis C-methylase UbiE
VASLYEAFQNALPSRDVEVLVRWLDQADWHPLMQELKRRMLELCPVRAGDRVLDLGCGLGHEVRRLGQLVGPEGRVLGIDANVALIAEARLRAADVALPIAYEVGDAHHLPLPDGSFDLCRTERVLRYLANPEAALREMARVLRPGGVAIAFDFDSDQTVVDAPDSALARRIADVLDAAVPHPWIGRRLFGMFKRAGLGNLRVVPYVVSLSGADGFAAYRRLIQGTLDRAVESGRIPAPDIVAWWAGLERVAREDTFFSANLGLIACGDKP